MTDGELVQSVLAGDSAAFARLYRTYVGAVGTIVRDNVHDPEDVADTVQEVFVRALERLEELKDSDRFKPWLFSIARHVAIDQRRSRRRDDRRLESQGNHDASDQTTGPEELAELRDLALFVEGCVAGLSARDATAVNLVAVGFSTTEVAAVLGTSVGAAKVALYRARNRLRDAVVLELMVRRNGAGCAEFNDCYKRGVVVDAARHIRTCRECRELAQSEIELYGSPESATATCGIDESWRSGPAPIHPGGKF